MKQEISSPLKNPLIVALDVDSRDRALQLADSLGEVVGGFKIGPRLCMRYGESLAKEISQRAPLFVDNKYFDIPSTMVAAVKASFSAGASLVTVHALSGQDALKEIAKLETELNAIRPFRILAVTVLTSWDQTSLSRSFVQQPIEDHVQGLAKEAATAGIKGIVCSPQELEFLGGKDFYLVTPGIRFDLQSHQDQKRVMGPKDAIKAGASALVVGRPILEAKNPLEEATDFVMACY